MTKIYVTLARQAENKALGLEATEWSTVYADTSLEKAMKSKASVEETSKNGRYGQEFKIEEVDLFD